MRTIVCLKQVFNVEGLKVDPKTRSLITERVERKISDFDKNALEEALRIREKEGGTVSVLTLGPPTAVEAAKEALNMGADAAHLIGGLDPTGLDARATADTLAAAVAKIGPFDLIVCGEASIDMYSAQVGPRLAERLGIPLVSHVRKVTVNAGAVTAERDLEDAYETVEVHLPVLLTVTKEINKPRIPTITMIIKGSKKAVNILDSTQLGQRPAVSVKVLKALAPVTERKRVDVAGEPQEVAEVLAHQLIKDGVVEA
jgi:electron transfer flavoprotein beta subunit